MKELKTHYIPTLSYLLQQGARRNYIKITTSQLADNISKSQQAVSIHLRELERQGLIHRMIKGRSISVRITPQGYLQMSRLYESLRSCIESDSKSIDLEGVLVSGSGEGRYYVAQDGYTKQFVKKIGYIPFPGTLNVRLDADSALSLQDIDLMRGTLIEGFSDGQRTYGWVRCYPSVINDEISCDLLRLERTHHDAATIELVANRNLRSRLQIKDGSSVSISVAL